MNSRVRPESNQLVHHSSPLLPTEPSEYFFSPELPVQVYQDPYGETTFNGSYEEPICSYEYPGQPFVPQEVPLQVLPSTAPQPSELPPTHLISSDLVNSNASNSQLNQTLRWLQCNFQFRKAVSISRSTIYEMYQKFCIQSHFVPVCKATFGKFPQVKSKRLGARGQSKYHYYNITFRDEVRFTRSSIPLNSCRSNRGWVWSSEENNESAIRFSLVSHGEQYPTDQFGTNLHENDYHAIIQSMLGVMKLPSDEPLINDKHIFVNLYKIHCQCLLDAALSGNFTQMRHYIMHFWQQLPCQVTIYPDLMISLDTHFYLLLARLYLSPDSTHDQLTRLNTIAHLMPHWLDRTFNHVVYDWPRQWAIGPHILAHITTTDHLTVAQIKRQDACLWRNRIQSAVYLLQMLQKLESNLISECVEHLQYELRRNSKRAERPHSVLSHVPWLTDYFPMDSLWSVLFEELSFLLANIKNHSTIRPSLTRLVIEEVDQMVRRVDLHYGPQNCNLALKQLVLLFTQFTNEVERGLVLEDSDSELEELDEDQEEIEEDGNTHEVVANAQLLLTAIQHYLVLMCQTSKLAHLKSLAESVF